MQSKRKIKIIATLGPASNDRDAIGRLARAGVDVFRFNFSHGDYEDQKARIQAAREVEAELGRPLALMADLQGPKIRIGVIAGDQAELISGASYRLDLNDAEGDARRAPLPHPEVLRALKPGNSLLLDDGRIRLRVDKTGPDYVDTTIIDGGVLRSRKGLNIPDITLPVSAMTDKDKADLQFALDQGVDWVALSFVQRPEDITTARKLIGGRAAVIAKIEKPAALEHIDEIIDLSDAIMVARGDLGVELPLEDVPGLQKRLIRLCRDAGKPVVVATQMLESMVELPVPTRAEVSDVANAIFDGADAIMLSAETASGDHPVQAVEVMNRVAARVETGAIYAELQETNLQDPEATAADAITLAARQVALTIGAAAIVTYTTSGSTALRAARERPACPLVVLTPRLATARRLSLAWGLHCEVTDDASNFAEMVQYASRSVKNMGYGSTGDRIVITAGVPFGTPGSTNILRIARLP